MNTDDERNLAYWHTEATEWHTMYDRACVTMWDAIGRDKANGTDDVFTLAKQEIERLRARIERLRRVGFPEELLAEGQLVGNGVDNPPIVSTIHRITPPT